VGDGASRSGYVVHVHMVETVGLGGTPADDDRDAPGGKTRRERVSARQRNQQGSVDVAGGDVALHPVGI